MSGSMLDDAFAHHIWATERLIDTCEALDPQQLDAGAPGTYGTIHRTLHHLVESDRWYHHSTSRAKSSARSRKSRR